MQRELRSARFDDRREHTLTLDVRNRIARALGVTLAERLAPQTGNVRSTHRLRSGKYSAATRTRTDDAPSGMTDGESGRVQQADAVQRRKHC